MIELLGIFCLVLLQSNSRCFECDRLVHNSGWDVAMISRRHDVWSRDLFSSKVTWPDNLRAKSFVYVFYVHWREVVSRNRSLLLLIFKKSIRFLLVFFFTFKRRRCFLGAIFCMVLHVFWSKNRFFPHFFKVSFQYYKMARATFSSKSQ